MSMLDRLPALHSWNPSSEVLCSWSWVIVIWQSRPVGLRVGGGPAVAALP
jgi:hypothetical protein